MRLEPSVMGRPDPAKESRFQEVFSKWAGRVRRRLALGLVLTGAAVGLAAGAGAAAAAWKLREGAVRPWTAAGGLLGAAAGAVIARRRRLSDTEVALYLDGKLGANEVVATAVELGKPAPASGPGSKKGKDATGENAGRIQASDSAAAASRDVRQSLPRESDPDVNPGYVVVLGRRRTRSKRPRRSRCARGCGGRGTRGCRSRRGSSRTCRGSRCRPRRRRRPLRPGASR